MRNLILTIVFCIALPIFCVTAKAQSPFVSEWSYNGADHPYYSILADFDNDGVLDIAISYFGDTLTTLMPTISIRRGNGDGTFQGNEYYAVGSGPLGIAAGDLNNDGWTDLAVACYSAETMEILLNDGTGGLVHAGTYAAAETPYGVKLGDFNLDGFLDVAMVCDHANTLFLYSNNGDGTFAKGVAYAAGVGSSELAVGDLNGDNYPDIVTTHWGGYEIGVFLNNGDGTFAPMQPYAVDVNSFGILLEDVDGNGTLDAIIANSSYEKVIIYSGNGDGTFGDAAEYATSLNAAALAFADFDNDGIRDILVTNDESDSYTLLHGNDGFTTSETFALPGTPYVFATGDVDGDGKLDIVVPLRGTNSVKVLLQADLASNVVAGATLLSDLSLYANKKVTFTFRDGVTEFSRTTRINADGAFLFAGIPAGAYELHIKGETTLATNVTVDTTAGNVFDVMAQLLSGDANDDNSVDVLDLAALITAFDATVGAANYNSQADFNGDGFVDVLDLDILIRAFDNEGAL